MAANAINERIEAREPGDGATHVILGVDGSVEAERAVGLVARVRWPASTRLQVVSVVPVWQDLVGLPWVAVGPVDVVELERSELTRVQSIADRAVSQLTAAGHNADASVVRGRPADALVEAAKRMRADLIVVGHRGMGGIETALVGSVSAEVVDHAPCAVLVVRGDELHTSVVADDGSNGARAALEYIAAHPHLLGAKTIVVGVVESPALWPDSLIPLAPSTMQMLIESREQAASAAADHVRASAATLTAATGRQVAAETPTGRPAAELIAVARRHHADLVVVGTHGRTGLARLALGSVSRNVLHNAPGSVLVVRPSVAHP